MPFLPPNQQRQSTEGNEQDSQYCDLKTKLENYLLQVSVFDIEISTATLKASLTWRSELVQVSCSSEVAVNME